MAEPTPLSRAANLADAGHAFAALRKWTEAIAAFDELIKDLSDSLDLTVFMITHDLDSLHAICDRVAVIADKKVVAVGTIAQLEKSNHPWIKEYFFGPRGRAAAQSEDGRGAS